MNQGGYVKHVVDPKTGEQGDPDGVLDAEDLIGGMHGEAPGREDLSGGGAELGEQPKAGDWRKAEPAAPAKAPAKAAAADKG